MQTSSANRTSFAFWPFGPIWDRGGFVGRAGELTGRGWQEMGPRGANVAAPTPGESLLWPSQDALLRSVALALPSSPKASEK